MDMEKICKYLGCIIEILGVIGSFNLAKVLGMSTKEVLFSTHVERDWGITISVFLGGVIVTSALAFLLFGISVVLDRIDYMEYNMSELKRQLEKKDEKEEDNKNTWKCPICGKRNQLYTGTCSCGQERV